MPDIAEIESGGGLKPVDPKKNRQQEAKYFSGKDVKKNIPNRLHVGEIVLGKIVSVPIMKEAYVSLPVGTLLAYLQGNLRKDDSLLFKVEQTAPALTLKVYGIASKLNTQFFSTDEILRILDLPSSKIYADIIDILKYQKSLIIRDDVLLINKSFSEIDEKLKKDYSNNLLLKVILFMQESNFPENQLMFRKIIPYFNSINILKDSFEQIEKHLNLLPEYFSRPLSDFIGTLKSSSITLSERIGLLIIKEQDDTKEDNFYNLLVKIIAETSGTNSENIKNYIRNSALRIVEIIDAQHLINNYAMQTNSPLFFIIPFFVEQDYKIIQLVIKSVSSKKSSKQNFEFFIIYETEPVNEVMAKGEINDEIVNFNILIKSEPEIYFLKTHFKGIEQIFSSKDLPIHKFGITRPDSTKFGDYTNRTSSQTDGFSVVV